MKELKMIGFVHRAIQNVYNAQTVHKQAAPNVIIHQLIINIFLPQTTLVSHLAL